VPLSSFLAALHRFIRHGCCLCSLSFPDQLMNS
jgi:hypothetical protein